MFAVRSNTGRPFHRSGLFFESTGFTVLKDEQMTDAIKATPALEVLEVSGMDDPQLAHEKILNAGDFEVAEQAPTAPADPSTAQVPQGPVEPVQPEEPVADAEKKGK